ncbi:Prostaglandin reductase 3 [Geranomyces variabilis]|nr:Prostaglandin reductase 3 [Geranomyces variabilis]
MSNANYLTPLPATFRKYVVHKLSTDFNDATRLETVDTAKALAALGPNQVAIHHKYWAINASDINYTAGRYDPTVKPPFDCGFEAVGQIIAVGSAVNNPSLKPGSSVAVMSYGAFAEIQLIDARQVIPVASARPEVLALLVSGLTSYLALKHNGQMRSGETVLVTAALGGAGQIAVQLAKLAGNTVIGTCSSDTKAEMLKKLGCDRVINYKTENVRKVLRKEYPRGIDIVFESVGGQMLHDCAANLAIKGRLIVIGSISNYATDTAKPDSKKAATGFGNDSISTVSLLNKSATVTGFFLPHYAREYPAALKDMLQLVASKKLIPLMDMADFSGIEAIPRAIAYMHEGKNAGKVIVPLNAAGDRARL